MKEVLPHVTSLLVRAITSGYSSLIATYRLCMMISSTVISHAITIPT